MQDDREQGQSSLAPIDTEAPISQPVQNDENNLLHQLLHLQPRQPPFRSSHHLTLPRDKFQKQLQRLCPVPYSQPGSSANTHAESYESDVGSSESFVYSMGLIKKVLMKPLMEVPRSPDGLVLLATMKKLKKSGLLNSQQLEIIQAYVDNFDSLVSGHPLYEHQTDRTSALKCSIEDKRKRVSDLKNHHGDLINNASSLAEERGEALKKRLDEIAEEEIHIREDLHTQLISWKAELETYMKALPEALRQQNEAENRANNSNDQWEALIIKSDSAIEFLVNRVDSICSYMTLGIWNRIEARRHQ
ncbi:hypothetical protein SADUNF_Sadunf05G0038000 [Salix dunnii]|uniref:Uncharacterized protein n=1 Tax=Salix dunnii TaxID=1413687 RepID=A0A835K6W8_9ROSI|nr:hypothetical protein SADUNF_Sadunf05G0038000 [Salix dunnii]